MLFSTPAFASDAATAATSTALTNSPLLSFLPFVLIFVVFYFLLIRPQMKQQKERQAMISAIKRGEKVVVNGIFGTVVKVEDDNTLQVEIAPEVKIKVLKSSISDVVGAKEATKDATDKK